MEKTFLEILPLAIAATFSPSGLLFVTMILSGKKSPVRHAVLFLLGAVAFLAVLGLVVMLTFKPAVNSENHPGTVSSAIDIILGFLMILLIGHSFISRKKQKQKRDKQRQRPFFIMGTGYMMINASSLIPFIAASKIIAENDHAFWDSLPLFLFLILVTMLMVSFPVLVTILLPAKSERVMVPVKSFMSKHGSQIARAYFFLIGLYLILHGITGIRGGLW
jgi:threonine/homoserine/homoserine lactone efflux protein